MKILIHENQLSNIEPSTLNELMKPLTVSDTDLKRFIAFKGKWRDLKILQNTLDIYEIPYVTQHKEQPHVTIVRIV